MFDPKKAALLILAKKDKGGDEESGAGGYDGEQDPSSLKPADALRAMYEAMKAGNFDKAADAFKAAYEACHEDAE